MSTQLINTLLSLSDHTDVVPVRGPFVAFTGSIVGAMLFNQLLFHTPRIADEDGWIVRSHREWAEELMASEYMVTKAGQELVDLGIVERKVERIEALNSSITHYRLRWEVLLEKWGRFIVSYNTRGGPSLTQHDEGGVPKILGGHTQNFGCAPPKNLVVYIRRELIESNRDILSAAQIEELLARLPGENNDSGKEDSHPETGEATTLDQDDTKPFDVYEAVGIMLGFRNPRRWGSKARECKAAKHLLEKGYKKSEILRFMAYMKSHPWWGSKEGFGIEFCQSRIDTWDTVLDQPETYSEDHKDAIIGTSSKSNGKGASGTGNVNARWEDFDEGEIPGASA